ncbi:hypothetical protein D3C85_687840 [compost metagenome]
MMFSTTWAGSSGKSLNNKVISGDNAAGGFTGAPRRCKVSVSKGGGGACSMCILRSAASSVPLI